MGAPTGIRGTVEGVDLMCGYGGATEGMKRAGIRVAAAYDWNAQAIDAHFQWHPDVPVTRRDVSEVRSEELAGKFVWASPSCKPWSTANRIRRGMDNPEYYPLARLVEQACDAAALVIENVAGLATERDGREELARLDRACHRLGLPYTVNLVRSNEHGVRQYRKRLFIVVGPMVVIPRGVPGPAEYAVLAGEYRNQFNNANGRFDARATVHGVRSLEERAELQGVPVPMGVSKRTAARLIGNAVPPVLAEFVCRQVLQSLEPRLLEAL